MSTHLPHSPEESMDHEDDTMRYNGFDEVISDGVKELAKGFVASGGQDDDGEIKSTANLELMRTLTNIAHVPGQVPMVEDFGGIDPRLDPNSPEFNSKFWILNLRKLYDSDLDYYKPAKLGVAYKNLRAFGTAVDSDYQSTTSNFLYKYGSVLVQDTFKFNQGSTFDILKPMEGVIRPGEVAVVLGRPGAGCSTFLKTIANQTYGFHVDESSILSYEGISPEDIKNRFRGDVVYCAETENHFPQLSVGDTLEFVARMKTPRNRPEGITREAYARHMAAVVMATYGLSHTRNTFVGNDFIRGVSGGERKRVSIAEVAIAQSALQCWDNSTRGLDSATALEFIKALKVSATVLNSTPLIAIYQCSQDAYDLFDKVILLYEGYQIYFGDSRTAKDYFVNLGYFCPPRQTTADFLTSITNPAERVVREGYEYRVPRTPLEFYERWNASSERAQVVVDVDNYLEEVEKKETKRFFSEAHAAKQSRNLRKKSPMTVSYMMQVKYIIFRNFKRIKGDPSITIFSILGNVILGLITSSIFYNTQPDTNSFFYRTSALFFAVLFNAFASLLEIFSLYEARPIVEKHKKFALYHPSADALASVVSELPTKIILTVAFNLVIYFMINLRRDPGHFFYFLLTNFCINLAMSHVFRTVGASFKTLQQSMTPASVILLMLIIFTGFVIPRPKMHGWCRWINYINPVAYAFESLVSNEFSGRQFKCSVFIPSGQGYNNTEGSQNFICSPVGSVIGETFVSGDAYINQSFQYFESHKWRNFGILIGFILFFLAVYISLCEYNRGAMQKGEVLLFQYRDLKKLKEQNRKLDVESSGIEKLLEKVSPEEKENESRSSHESEEKFPKNQNIFFWKNLSYEVKIKKENRVILNDIDGWVKPGQVTALMGASGAGKTTLLNALSERLTSGSITSGVRMVNGHLTDESFQRSIGYVQQQDLHLETATVKESLKFAAYLRQPASVPKAEKDAYVDYIIDLLEMSKYANAVVGVAGEGLNVEQRKRLTIGVELVAKPKLLVFLDEPTSGLDSQTAWSICKLIRKLADSGQSILCTIHQPSAILLQEFDRLLFLQKGGRTVYFGDLGKDCSTLINYFVKYGAPPCPHDANPAEWMLEVIGAAPGSSANQDYFEVWKNSTEHAEVKRHIEEMETELSKLPRDEDPEDLKLFATSYLYQYYLVSKRVFQKNWRTPSYTYSKILLAVFSALFNGFSFFKADKSLQGLQNQMFSIFMFLIVFNTVLQQYLPNYVTQRDLYEVRERPSKTFSWLAFITAEITAEIPWQILLGTLSFFLWYYPVGLYTNAVPTNTVHERGALMWISIVMFFVYAITMGQLCISFNELAQNAANLASLLYTMCLTFCGVLAPASSLPGFWLFMYRVNPFTYLIQTMMSLALADSEVTCASSEFNTFYATNGLLCGEFMKQYMEKAGGYLLDENSTSLCHYCSIKSTNVFLASVGAFSSQNSRNLGIFACYIFINIIGTIFLYWLARVPKGSKHKMK